MVVDSCLEEPSHTLGIVLTYFTEYFTECEQTLQLDPMCRYERSASQLEVCIGIYSMPTLKWNNGTQSSWLPVPLLLLSESKLSFTSPVVFSLIQRHPSSLFRSSAHKSSKDISSSAICAATSNPGYRQSCRQCGERSEAYRRTSVEVNVPGIECN